VPESGAAVFDGDASVGEVTRAAIAPSREATVALAYVRYDTETEGLAVRVDGEELPAHGEALPFVEGSARSARLPSYPGTE
jgi:aminomethyltransferase